MTASPPFSPSDSASSAGPDPLPMRWAVIIIAATVIALLAGALTFAETQSWPAALLAGFGAAGLAVPALHQVVGR